MSGGHGSGQGRDFRTPVSRAQGLGSAKSGTSHFWWIRVTSVALVPLTAWFLGTLVSMVGGDLDSARATLARPWNAILFTLFLLAMFWHAKLGLQVVIEDYINKRAVEVALQLLVVIACAAGALAGVYAIGRIAFLA